MLKPDENWRRKTPKLVIPTRLVFHSARSVIKVKYDYSRRAINHPCGASVGEEECAWELRLDRRNQAGRGGECALSKKRNSPVWGRGVWGSKRPIVHFGVSVNNPP
ncbi:hypothetical protein AVEN_231240-1 [Araneus ventricosus]|uniref:Uncharacterized protein n=1 Tax=Araneus ventricosus TaxID=182803 RepID=A0A4Y2IHR6_ARAVE|nr:hypothetical protein AVEN_231240-1 [Araneus ventricosus]